MGKIRVKISLVNKNFYSQMAQFLLLPSVMSEASLLYQSRANYVVSDNLVLSICNSY